MGKRRRVARWHRRGPRQQRHGVRGFRGALRTWWGAAIAIALGSVAAIGVGASFPSREWHLVTVMLVPAAVLLIAHSEGARPRSVYRTPDHLAILAVGITVLATGGSEASYSAEVRVLVAGLAVTIALGLYLVIPAKTRKLQTDAESEQHLRWLARYLGWIFRPSDVLAVAALWMSIVFVLPDLGASWGLPAAEGDNAGSAVLVILMLTVSWIERNNPYRP